MANKELLRTIKFTLFSISAGAIEIGSFALLNELLKLDYWVSYLIALILSVFLEIRKGFLRTSASSERIFLRYHPNKQ